MRAEFIEPGDARWAGALRDVDHDVFHLPEYVAYAARQAGGEPAAFFAEEAAGWLLIPTIIRPIDRSLTGDLGHSASDAISPYGYPSPLTSLPAEPDGPAQAFLDRALDAYVAALGKQGVVCAFIRLHPLLPVPLAALRRVGTVVNHGDTVHVDLALSDDEMWRQTRRGHRVDVLAAKRQGQVVRIDERWDRFNDFVAIYDQTMRRLEADDFYRFSRDDFGRLIRALGDRIHLSVVELDGVVVCSGLVTEVGGFVQTFLGGTKDGCLSLSPNKTRIDFLRSWAKARGNRVLHLGGGVGGSEDALFRFKAGFSHRRSPFLTWRVVADEQAYRRLVTDWEARHGASADGADGFFPAYRKP